MNHPRTTEFLLKLGNDAAQRFCADKTPLTEAVRDLRDTLKLTDEETRRVAENANKSAYLKMFHAAPADNKVVSFPLADAESIIGTTEKVASFCDYSIPRPDNFKTVKMERYSAAYDDFEKRASTKTTAETRNVKREWLMTKRAAEIIRGRHTVADRKLSGAKEAFQKEAKELFRQGHTLGDLLQALLPFTKQADADLLMTLKPVISEPGNRVDIRTALTVKEASLPNEDHPLVHSFKDLIQSANEYRDAEKALFTANESEKRLRDEVLREAK